jgi:hypothetical protein
VLRHPDKKVSMVKETASQDYKAYETPEREESVTRIDMLGQKSK